MILQFPLLRLWAQNLFSALVDGISRGSHGYITVLIIYFIDAMDLNTHDIAYNSHACSAYFSKMASSAESRGKFVNSVKAWMTKYNAHGVDLDWEFPCSPARKNPVL